MKTKSVIKTILIAAVMALIIFAIGTTGAMESGSVTICAGAIRIIVAVILSHICITAEELI